MEHGRSLMRASAQRHTTVAPKRSTRNSNIFSKQGLQLRRSISAVAGSHLQLWKSVSELQVQNSHDLQTANRETLEILVSLKQVKRFPNDGAIFVGCSLCPVAKFFAVRGHINLRVIQFLVDVLSAFHVCQKPVRHGLLAVATAIPIEQPQPTPAINGKHRDRHSVQQKNRSTRPCVNVRWKKTLDQSGSLLSRVFAGFSFKHRSCQTPRIHIFFCKTATIYLDSKINHVVCHA